MGKMDQFKKELISYKNTLSTPDENFNETKQFSIDFNFVGQLVDVLKDINNEFGFARLKIEDISGYDGKNFIVKSKKINLEGIKKYAKELDEENKKEFFKQLEEQREKEEDEKDWKRKHPFD